MLQLAHQFFQHRLQLVPDKLQKWKPIAAVIARGDT